MDWVMPWRRQISATDSWPLSPSRTTSSFALAVQRRRFSEGCCFSLISSHSRDGVFDERAHSPLRHCQPLLGVSIRPVYDSTYEGLKRTGLGLAGTNPGLRLYPREPVILSSRKQELLSGAPIIFFAGIIKDRTNQTLYQPAPLLQATPPSSVAAPIPGTWQDRKSTRLNSSHVKISYAVFCL